MLVYLNSVILVSAKLSQTYKQNSPWWIQQCIPHRNGYSNVFLIAVSQTTQCTQDQSSLASWPKAMQSWMKAPHYNTVIFLLVKVVTMPISPKRSLPTFPGKWSLVPRDWPRSSISHLFGQSFILSLDCHQERTMNYSSNFLLYQNQEKVSIIS
jgi:hypothetical protein